MQSEIGKWLFARYARCFGNHTPLINPNRLTIKSHKPNNLLISGVEGSGKSTLLQMLADRLYSQHAINCKLLACRKDLGWRDTKTMSARVGDALLNLGDRTPAVLFLDDLDAILAHSPSEGEADQVEEIMRNSKLCSSNIER